VGDSTSTLKGFREHFLAHALSSSRVDSGPEESAIFHERLVLPNTISLRSLTLRVLTLVALFSSELLVVSGWLDGESLSRAGLVGLIRYSGSWILRWIVGFAAIFATFAYLKYKDELGRISAQVARTPIRWRVLAAHGSAMIVFGGLSSVLYAGRGSESWANPLAASWLVAGISAIAFAGGAFLPWTAWVQVIRSTGHLWAYASIAVISACGVGQMFRWLWQPASFLTFDLIKVFLSPFVSSIVANPATLVIGTQRFRVQIAPECSGLEGVALILSFGILWLLLFKRECRFPQSLALIPVSVAVLFLLNAVRIAALILIGNAGARQIALGGFHSQGGWIAFSAVSVGFCFVSQQVPWFTTRQPSTESLATATHNPTAAFLLPFVMMLAGGMLAGAAARAGSVEWLYPLGFFAAAGTLWIYRNSYARLNWKCDWVAPAMGVIVFVIWIALDRFSNSTTDSEVSVALKASPVVAKVIWITIRVLAAVVTVPLAEELAFRGFLMRRLVSADFESVSFRRLTWFALLASSIVFGFLHGGYWIAGSLAGILFGLAVIRRGQIGDAVVAHATANALLAAYILTYHKWHLW
jgi:exosortase E/protease (VPEID-CTERM system)